MIRIISVFFFIPFLWLACDNGGDPTPVRGTLSIEMSDDPFPTDLVETANVTISKIEIRGEDSLLTLTEVPQSANLLELRNGVTASLVNLEIPVGSYDLVRLIITDASVVMKDGTTHTLKIPSAAQTGLKVFIDPPIQVEGDLTSELLLDFDVSKSFVVQGNIDTPAGIKGFIFKPVIRAQNLSTAGRLTGTIRDTAPLFMGNAQVWVEQDSVVSFTFSDTTTGDYGILGLPAGFYTLKATKQGYDTVSVANTQITAANETIQDLVLTRQ